MSLTELAGQPPQVVVVEPHADDAYLSLHGHLVAWRDSGVRVRIVTVYGEADPYGPRWAEAAAYARSVGAEWHGVGLTESGRGIADDTWHPQPLAGIVLHQAMHPTGWGHAIELLPLGLRHPEHLAVAGLAHPDAWRYLEQPYGAKAKNTTEVATQLMERRVVSWVRPANAAKAKAGEVFKSQRRFFFNEADNLRNAPELIVGAP